MIDSQILFNSLGSMKQMRFLKIYRLNASNLGFNKSQKNQTKLKILYEQISDKIFNQIILISKIK